LSKSCQKVVKKLSKTTKYICRQNPIKVKVAGVEKGCIFASYAMTVTMERGRWAFCL
jgi:hypothetical protein